MKSCDNCCVCLKGESLISLNDVHSNNDTVYSKLRCVVPEVPWKETFSICSNCLRTLDVVIEFRNLCLKSSSYRVEEKKNQSGILKEIKGYPIQHEESNDYKIEELHEFSDEVHQNYLDKMSEVLCKVCSIKFHSDELLLKHNVEIHQSGLKCSNYSPIKSVMVQQEINSETDENDEAFCEGINEPQYNSEDCNNTDSPELQYEKCKKSNKFVCFHCNKSYNNKAILAKHIKVSHQNDKLRCSKCSLICGTERLLKKHKIVHISETIPTEKNKLYECSKCKKSYKIEKVMKNHYETCDGIKRHSKLNSNRDCLKNRCQTCGRFYTTEKILKAHIKTCSGSKVKIEEEEIKCKICNTFFINNQVKLEHVLKKHNVNLTAENICQYCYTQFSNSTEYKDHLEEVHSDDIFKREKRSYSCEVCSKIFRYVKDVIEHCCKEHEMDSKLVKPFLCNKCDTRFTSSANMIQHKQYHEGTRSHICSFCGKSYITKSDLTVHEYTHLNKRNYKCEICDRAFNTNKNLRSHKLVVHTDSSLWKYHCNMCDKRFPLKSGYDQHTRRHAGDKRFQCLICLKSFISSSELRKHMAFHSNVRAFKCSHCDKEYKERRVYEIHLTKVHGIGNAKIPIRVKKFACHICPSTFFDKQKLSRHLCTHTGMKPHACTMCEKRFTDKSYLKHHLKVTHNVVEIQFEDMGDVKIMQVVSKSNL